MALAQKKKEAAASSKAKEVQATKTKKSAAEGRSPVAPEPVTLLAQDTHGSDTRHGKRSGSGNTTAAYDAHSYQHKAAGHEDKHHPHSRDKHTQHMPKADKQMEYLSAPGKEAPDLHQFDTHKMTQSQLKQKHQLAGRLQRYQYNSRDGWMSKLGYNNLLRPWNEDYVKAQRRACQRREEAQKQDNCDSNCVQFNESSYMYEGCIDH